MNVREEGCAGAFFCISTTPALLLSNYHQLSCSLSDSAYYFRRQRYSHLTTSAIMASKSAEAPAAPTPASPVTAGDPATADDPAGAANGGTAPIVAVDPTVRIC